MYQHTRRHGEEGRVTIDILMKLVVINTVQYIIISTQMTKQLQSTPNTFMKLSTKNQDKKKAELHQEILLY